ncbi:TonB-dependent receptor [Sphingomonas nostoxanthinifaciens]|uniref:TonB-dependent receptor n=1 Tax=Sphingomonas nostoxanthinifaciens TaxID=2872652 RepID=UPI001CC1EBE3|nr:TonB-dependent siderophore receptor [Sphingomonas nostoxanthinifaciens]UAK25816.1 TonB-dependent receptor [Sphingomonas nostoxanthinifaciens]
MRRIICSGAMFVATSVLGTVSQAQDRLSAPSDIVVTGVEGDAIHDETQTASLGPLGLVDVHDTPNTINIVPSALIEQQQLKSVQDVFRYLPSVQGDGARPQSRGFQGSVVQNSRIDGFNIVSTTDYAAQQFENVQVLNGLSGAIFGPANPAGTFEYTLKRPTAQPLAYGRIGYGSGDLWLEHLDVSNTAANGLIGYRANLLNEAGEAYLDNSRVSRQLASLALDVHVAPSTVLELNGSYYRYQTRGVEPSFATANGVAFPEIDPYRQGYAQPYAGQRNHTYTGSAKLRHDIGSDWHLTVGVLDQVADRETSQITDTITNAAGAYTATIQTSTASRFTILSNQAYLDGQFDTGPLRHQLALGTNGFVWKNFNPYAGATFTLGSGTLANPRAFARPNLPDFTDRYRSSRAWQQVLVASDRISIGEHWSAVLTGSQSWLGTINSNSGGSATSRSSDTGFSPSASLVYKPIEPLTVYFTYANSLQQGDTAPAGTVNQNSILAPFRSKQYEGGVKLGLKAVDFTLAAFQISRPFAYINAATSVFEQDGEQRNRGVELTANGRVLPGLTVFGGVAFLDPKLLDTATAATNDTRIAGLSRWTMTSLVTWAVPRISGLQLTAFVRHASNRPTDNQNRFFADGYTTLDLGVKKDAVFGTHHVTFRVDVANVTDERYLTNIVPGGLNGYSGAGNATAALGQPRTVAGSVAFAL